MNLSAQSSPVRDIPHERPLTAFEHAERMMERERHRASIRRDTCHEFLSQHDGDPDPAMLIATWFTREADRIQNRTEASYQGREDRNWEAAVVGKLLAELLNAKDPMDAVVAIAEGR